jgi:hypothetical protein
MTPSLGSRRPVIIGADTRTLLMRRRRWIRWLALLVAALAVISIVLQFRRHRASRRPVNPAAIVRDAIYEGHVLGKNDVEIIMPDAESPGLISPVRLSDVAGRVAFQDLVVGDDMTSDVTAPVSGGASDDQKIRRSEVER